MMKNNKYEKYRSEDCTKKFCKDLKKHVVEIIFYRKKNVTVTS